jgi:hypothetical protein
MFSIDFVKKCLIWIWALLLYTKIVLIVIL